MHVCASPVRVIVDNSYRIFVSDTHCNAWEKLLETTDEEAKVWNAYAIIAIDCLITDNISKFHDNLTVINIRCYGQDITL